MEGPVAAASSLIDNQLSTQVNEKKKNFDYFISLFFFLENSWPSGSHKTTHPFNATTLSMSSSVHLHSCNGNFLFFFFFFISLFICIYIIALETPKFSHHANNFATLPRTVSFEFSFQIIYSFNFKQCSVQHPKRPMRSIANHPMHWT